LTPGEFDDPNTAEKLLDAMAGAQVARACVVQRAHVYGFDNSYVLDTAKANPDTLAAVVVLKSHDPSTPSTLRQLKRTHDIKGVRFVADSFPTSSLDWVLSDAARDAWKAAAELDLPICIHVLYVQRDAVLPALYETAKLFPSAAVVVDHVGGAHPGTVELNYMKGAELVDQSGIHEAARRLSELPNITMKLSTINFERIEARHENAARFVDDALATFGASRLIWGSDVGQSRCSYSTMTSMLEESISHIDEPTRQAIRYENANRLYFG
jgi:predicted TIM-barrel fold metal-dependent hydrolase